MVDREGEALRAELTAADFANNIDPVLKAIAEAGEMEPLADSLRKLAAADRIERVGSGRASLFQRSAVSVCKRRDDPQPS